jgi:hypothetical protein
MPLGGGKAILAYGFRYAEGQGGGTRGRRTRGDEGRGLKGHQEGRGGQVRRDRRGRRDKRERRGTRYEGRARDKGCGRGR